MFTPDLFRDKVYVITGGGTGLGRAMGEYLASLGATLVLTSRSADHLESGATAMRAAGAPRVVTIPCDIRDPLAVQAMVQSALDQTGRIDGLINNAAGNIACPTEYLSANAFNAVVGIVLHGTFHCTQALGKHWIGAQLPGRVLSVVTTYAWTGSAFVVPSACAKAGVLAMTQSLAVEWGKYGIRLNAVAPGPFPTEGAWQRLFPAGFEAQITERNPTKRLGKPEELARLAAFLLSDAADYINGACITIDGGEWLAGAGQFNELRHLDADGWKLLREQAKKG